LSGLSRRNNTRVLKLENYIICKNIYCVGDVITYCFQSSEFSELNMAQVPDYKDQVLPVPVVKYMYLHSVYEHTQ